VLCGLLHPSGGKVRVDGFVPYAREAAYLRRMTMVMGGKSQMIWDLPPADSFEMIRALYRIERSAFRVQLDELVNLLQLAPLLHKPTRQLSLGERMRCEFAAALIHRPRVLFLDEPTLGLDAAMQAAVRSFIRDYNRLHGASVLLTSHYMQDVSAICPRVVVINQGRLVYDGDLRGFVRTVKPERVVSFRCSRPGPRRESLGSWRIEWRENGNAEIRVPNDRVAELVSTILALPDASDLMIEDPSLDDVLREVYGQPAREASA